MILLEVVDHSRHAVHGERPGDRHVTEEVAEQLLVRGQCTACEVSLCNGCCVVLDERGVQRRQCCEFLRAVPIVYGSRAGGSEDACDLARVVSVLGPPFLISEYRCIVC